MSGDETKAPAAEDGGAAAAPSKRALKKLRRAEERRQIVAEAKRRKKEDKRRRREELAGTPPPPPANPSEPSVPAAPSATSLLSPEERAAVVAERKRRRTLRCEGAPRVAIDLGFLHLSTDKVTRGGGEGGVDFVEEKKSLVLQLQYLYGVNKKAAQPLDLHLVGLRDEGALDLLGAVGFERWSAKRDERPLMDVFSKDEVIYLTSDATETLDRFDLDKV
jgi:hypothetical protein